MFPTLKEAKARWNTVTRHILTFSARLDLRNAKWGTYKGYPCKTGKTIRVIFEYNGNGEVFGRWEYI